MLIADCDQSSAVEVATQLEDLVQGDRDVLGGLRE